jgi:hypothetical protein
MFETPILLIIFNRPETTRRVFEVIRQQKPMHFYVAADGPRHDRNDDIEKCKAAREVINVDWECEFQTLYRTENRGCGHGPAEAITWFFNNVEQGIILEDDIIPDTSFFNYCAELLIRFKDDERVAMISGINLLSPWKTVEASYFFSFMGGIPGWATWRRSWVNFDMELSEWKTKKSKQRIKDLLGHNEAFDHFGKYFDHFSNVKRDDMWDYQWLYSRWNARGCSIVPSINLLENIGFGPDATHTITPDHPQAKMRADRMTFPLRHRSFIIDREYDRIIFKTFIKDRNDGFLRRIIGAAKKLLRMFNWRKDK